MVEVEVVGGWFLLVNRLCSAKDSCFSHPRGAAKTPDAGDDKQEEEQSNSVCLSVCLHESANQV